MSRIYKRNTIGGVASSGGGGGVGGGVAQWSSEQTYKSGEMVRVNRSLFLAKTDNQNSQPLTTKHSLDVWDVVVLNEPYTFAIPDIFATLTDAVAYFSVVSSAAPITFAISGEITDNEIVITNSAVPLFNINGGQLNLGEKNGVLAIGSGVNVAINNTKFVGVDSAGGNAWTNNATAAFALDGAAITITDITTTNVYYGAQAARASLNGSGCTFTGAGDTGVLAFDGGQIRLSDCASNNAYDAANALGWGYVAEAGASLWLQNCTSTGNVKGGLFANIGGHIRDDNGTHRGNVRGCVVRAGSNIELTSSDVGGSTSTNAEVNGGTLTCWSSKFSDSVEGQGIYAGAGATVHLNGATVSNNKLYGIYAEQLAMVKLNSSIVWEGNGSGNSNHAVGTLASDGALIAN